LTQHARFSYRAAKNSLSLNKTWLVGGTMHTRGGTARQNSKNKLH
jgi:hypothetical protein